MKAVELTQLTELLGSAPNKATVNRFAEICLWLQFFLKNK